MQTRTSIADQKRKQPGTIGPTHDEEEETLETEIRLISFCQEASLKSFNTFFYTEKVAIMDLNPEKQRKLEDLKILDLHFSRNADANSDD